MSAEYAAQLYWSGSTRLGWAGYDRTHTAVELTLTTGEAMGDRRRLNPEQLLVVAAASCQMLWFLHLAAKARLDVVEYVDGAVGDMPDDRLTRITLRPRVVVLGDPSEERLLRLTEQAHARCNVAKSLRTAVLVHPTWATVPWQGVGRPDGSG